MEFVHCVGRIKGLTFRCSFMWRSLKGADVEVADRWWEDTVLDIAVRMTQRFKFTCSNKGCVTQRHESHTCFAELSGIP